MLLFYKTLIMFGLHLKNYKSFEDQAFDFSKINILIGTNSSGKSSLLKFFLMLKQSLYYNPTGKLSLNGNEVNLGRFEDIIIDNKTDKSIEFEFSMDLKNSFKNEEPLSSYFNLKSNIIKFKYEFDSSLNINKVVIEHLEKGKLLITIENQNSSTKKEIFEEGQKCNIIYFKNDEIVKELTNLSFNQKGLAIVPSLPFRRGENEIDNDILFLRYSQIALNSHFLDQIEYFNPFLSNPKKTYQIEDDKNIVSIRNLDNAVQVLADDSDEDKVLIDILKENLALALKDLGIADDFYIEKGERIKVLELKIKLIGEETYRNIMDVGFGVSLQIPLLLQAIASTLILGGRPILIEQPEIHIHPKLQAKLMEVLVKYGEKNTYFIETHSIHFIEALQVMVKKGLVKKEDVTIHYFTKENSRTKVSVHKIEDDGFLDIPIPEDFMDVSFNLTSQLLA